jgi:ADP-heptose:LPS heptosyltransferase
MRKKNKILVGLKSFLIKWLCNKTRHPFNAEGVSKILIMRYDRIGDMVVTTPLFNALRIGFPKAEMIVLASASNASVIANNPDVDKIIIFPIGLWERFKVLIALRRLNISLVVDIHHDMIWHAIYAIRILNPRWVVSSYKKSRYGVRGCELKLYDFMGSVDENHMISEIYSGISTSLGIPRFKNDLQYKLVLTDAQKASAYKLISSELNVGINLLGSKVGWQLTDEDCKALCAHILNLYPNTKIWILSTPSSYLKMVDLSLEIHHPAVQVVKPTSDVMDAAAIIASLDLLITPDTSLVHIACAFNTPLVAVYPDSPNAFIQWKPLHLSGKCKVIFSKHEKSLEGYSYGELLEAVDKLIKTD